MKKKTFLVTGGTGFIGSNICKLLLKKNYNVKIFDNNFRGSPSKIVNIKKKVKFIRGDIRNIKSLNKAMKQTDAVIHLAYINGTKYFYTKPVLTLDIAMKGIINVIDLCIKNRIRELYLASSSEVYQTPDKIPTDESEPLRIPDIFNPRYSYGGGKILTELMGIHYGKKYFKKLVIFRPHNVYGPDMGWEHVLPQFATRMNDLNTEVANGVINFPIQGSGNETRAFVYIDDFIDGVLKVVQKGEHLNLYHIGTSEEVSISDLACLVAKAYSREINIIPSQVTPGSTPRRCPDISKISALGFNPKVPLEQGVNKLVNWYRNNKPTKRQNKI